MKACILLVLATMLSLTVVAQVSDPAPNNNESTVTIDVQEIRPVVLTQDEYNALSTRDQEKLSHHPAGVEIIEINATRESTADKFQIKRSELNATSPEKRAYILANPELFVIID